MRVTVGWVVVKDGKALRTGGYYRGLTAKLYQKIGTAKAVAKTHGGEVVEAFVEL